MVKSCCFEKIALSKKVIHATLSKLYGKRHFYVGEELKKHKKRISYFTKKVEEKESKRISDLMSEKSSSSLKKLKKL